MPRRDTRFRRLIGLWCAGVVCSCGDGLPLEEGDLPFAGREEEWLGVDRQDLTVGTGAFLYREALSPGWADWSWASRSLANTTPVSDGTRSIRVTFGAWTGLYFQHAGFNTTGTSALIFRAHGGSGYDAARVLVRAVVNDQWSVGTEIGRYCSGGKIAAQQWVTCQVPLSAFGAANRTVHGVVFQENAGRSFSSGMYLDELGFLGSVADAGSLADAGSKADAGTVGTVIDAGTATDAGSNADAGQPVGGVIEPGNPGAADITFSIRADTSLTPISPLIYGSNDARDLSTVRQGLVRAGGNRWTAYNWENNASNAGSDWCFQNDGLLSGSSTAGEAVRQVVAAANTVGAATLVTVPIVDYVAADKLGGSDPPGCSGDVRNTANFLATRFKQNRARKGSAFTSQPDPNDAYVYQDEFTQWMQGAAAGGQILYSLDNEPDLWVGTHSEVHPTAVGYDELCSRNVSYASAIKAVVPNAKVLGFVSYGWYGLVTLQDAPDAAGKGEFVDYYLGKMRAAELSAGRRLIDYLDLHWYPEAQGGGVRIIGPETGAAVVEARLQAPRSLWDSTYFESSWIQDYLGAEAIALIRRMKSKIAASYPGTGLAVTEWNYGGGGHISGAIATADVLGIFGREGVGLSNLWELNSDERFTYAAVQAYRNFDGVGGRFGDTGIGVTNSDRVAGSAYASIESANPNRVVIIALNKRSVARTAAITLAHHQSFRTAKVFTLTSATPRPLAGTAISATATNAFRYTMPAYSVSILVPEP